VSILTTISFTYVVISCEDQGILPFVNTGESYLPSCLEYFDLAVGKQVVYGIAGLFLGLQNLWLRLPTLSRSFVSTSFHMYLHIIRTVLFACTYGGFSQVGGRNLGITKSIVLWMEVGLFSFPKHVFGDCLTLDKSCTLTSGSILHVHLS
jgi:hypothetical protein